MDERRPQRDHYLRLERWRAGLARLDQLNEEILQRRQGKFVDVESAMQAARAELEARNDFLFSHHDKD